MSMTRFAEQLAKNKPQQPQAKKPSVIDKITSIVGYDTFMVFGDSGTCKTTFALWLANEFAKTGKKVYYIDTERNLVEEPSHENIKYYYSPDLNDVYNMILNITSSKMKLDLIVIDSIGLPILAGFAQASLKEKGDMLLRIVDITWRLKVWTFSVKGMALIINQPTSPIGKEAESPLDLDPFGGKSKFACKEIWFSDKVASKPDLTECRIVTWRSRRFGRGKELFRIRVSDRGVEVKPVW